VPQHVHVCVCMWTYGSARRTACQQQPGAAQMCTNDRCTMPWTATHSPALREAAGGDLFILQLDIVHVPREDELACAGYARRAYVSHNQIFEESNLEGT
jgi:hypothetical protein